MSPRNSGSASKALGRILAIDLGEKRVGVAICDELGITVRPLARIERHSWKDFLTQIRKLIASFDVKAMVIGLPLSMNGSEGDAAQKVQQLARKFRLSLEIPVYLQDERLTSEAARSELKNAGFSTSEIQERLDSEAAATILRDFLASNSDSGELNQR